MLKSLCIAVKLCTTLSGPATIIDGDTIIVEGIHVRIMGLDAEELSEPHGLRAKQHMQELTHDRVVECTTNGDRSYNRYIGTCFIRGVDLAQSMIADGFALDCAHYSHGKYRKYEPQNIRLTLIQKGYC